MSKLHIRHKILLCIYLVLFPVLLVTGGLMAYRSYRSAVDIAMPQYAGALQMIDENINYMERDLKEFSIYFSVNNEIAGLLSGPADRVAGNPLFWNDLPPMDVISDMLSIKSHIRTLILYPENGLPPFYASRDASVHQTDINIIRTLPIYEAAILARGDSVREQMLTGEQGIFLVNTSNKMVFCRELFDLSKQKRLGFLVASLDIRGYEKICEAALLQDNEAIVIVGVDGIEVTHVGEPDERVLEEIRTGQISLDGQEMVRHNGFYIFVKTISSSGDTIYYLSPQSNWDARLVEGISLPIVLAFVLLICVWPISALGSRIISGPLDTLYDSMRKFKAGDFEQQVHIAGSDEIAELADTFNHMVNDLRGLIERNYVMRLREQESELAALQAQINPHFLYNTLDSLYWQAVEDGQENMAENVLALAELFRLLLSSGESEISVEQELKIVTNYLHLQKMRFSRRLDYSIEVEDEILSVCIPKLILQPFVENAIVHGMERKETWGYVKVLGRREGALLHFIIEDDGVGMSQEKIDELLSDNGEKRYASQRVGHYAIRNVRERMSLRYGENFEMRISSEVGVGSVVHIVLPLEPEMWRCDHNECEEG